MARRGLYKSEIKKARDTLVGQGKHPSVDAVRIELGNTGSKTTIHKYLKELEEQDSEQSPNAPLSNVLQDLVVRLATQLQEEADSKISAIRSEANEAERRQAAKILELQQENTTLRTSLQQSQKTLVAEDAAHKDTIKLLGEASAGGRELELQITGLKERLEENERHRKSLEEKHLHARESLEHYRASTKEQRDQDIWRHEQQVQGLQAEVRQLQQSLVVKQDEVTRINQEGVRLVSDLSHAQQTLYEQLTRVRQSEQKLEQLHAKEQLNELLKIKIDEKDVLLIEMNTHVDSLSQQVSLLTEQLHQGQKELVTLQAHLDAHQTLSDELRLYLNHDGTRK